MRRVIMLLTILSIGTLSFAAWESIGPDGGYLRSCVCSATNEDLVYVSTYYDGKIVKSIDGAASWDKVGSYSYYNYCLAIDPQDDNTLYAGSIYRVYKSTDGGATWDDTYVVYIYFNDLVVHPTNSSIIYGAARRYIASGNYGMEFVKSTDGGATFTNTTLESGGYCYGWAIAVDPSNPNTVYVGGNGYGTSYEPRIYKSTDGGSSFTQVYSATSGYYVYSMAVHPTNSDIVYAGTYTGGILRSTDAGSTWNQVSTLYYNYRMRTTPADPDVVYSSAYTAVYRSTNAGLTWTSTSTGLSGNYFYGLAVSPTNSSNVYTTNRAGCFKTTNMGSNWFDCNDGMTIASIIGMGVAPSQHSTMYITNEDVGVFKTTNNGNDWTQLPSFSSCGDMCAFAIENTNPDIVLALEGFG